MSRVLERVRDVVQVSSAGGAVAHVGQGSTAPRLAHVGQFSIAVPPDHTSSSAGGLAHVGQRVELAHVVQAAERLGIDEHGLGREEQAILELLLLARRRPMGLEAIAARLGIDLETLRVVHEPPRERSGLVESTERGRVATEKARSLYGARGRPRGVLERAAPRRPLGIAILAVPLRL